jgi:DNA replication protein DnaC
MTSDPTIVTLDDYPDPQRDRYWVAENLDAAARHLAETLPVHYADAVADHPDVVAWVKAVVESAVASKLTVPALTTGPSLLLCGRVGRGKTHQAWGAVRALAVTGLRIGWVVVTAADLYALLRPRAGVDSETVFQHHARARLLVLDDVGASKSTEWTEEINYRLVNHRYENELPTLFTSNLPPKELPAMLGDRVASRLIEMTSPVVLRGEDRRRAA